MTFIDGTVVNVALPALQAELNATITDVQWVGDSFGRDREPIARDSNR